MDSQAFAIDWSKTGLSGLGKGSSELMNLETAVQIGLQVSRGRMRVMGHQGTFLLEVQREDIMIED